ncbi:MAG: MFS transporter [Actinomycetota bacterium]
MLARLVGIQVAAAMVVLGIPALNPALREEFSLTRGGAGLTVTAVFLGVVVGSWSGGRLVNAIGVRRSMLLATAGLGGGFALVGTSWSFPSALAILFLVGLFYSPVTPATNVGVVAWASPGFRTRSMAIKQMGVTAGASISAALIPALTAAYGWRTAALVVGVLVVLAGAASAHWFRRPEAAQAPPSSGRLENRPVVVAVGFGALLLLFVQHCVSTHYILALQDDGLGLIAAGASLSLLQASATGARFGWAWVADRWLRGDAALGVLVLNFASAAVLSAMTLFEGTGAPVLAALFLGATTQAGNGLMQVVLADSGGSSPATSTGLGMALGFTGTVIGPPLFGLLSDAVSYRSAWIFLALVALACGILTWRAARAIDL